MSRWLSILILFSVLSARAGGKADALTAAGVAEFTAAYQAWDGPGSVRRRNSFRQASTNAPANCTNCYWLGTAWFHRMLQLQNPAPANPPTRPPPKPRWTPLFDALKAAVKLCEGQAESHALLGTRFNGMKINGNLLRRCASARAWRNIATRPRNPARTIRASSIARMCQFHTAKKPAGYREAFGRPCWRRKKLFEAEAKVAPGPA